MKHLTIGKKLLSLVLAMVMVASLLSVSASASTNVYEAKQNVAKVVITQNYNGADNNNAVHDYNKDGKTVTATYKAELKMTDDMADYLQPRQAMLYRADFTVNVELNDDAVACLEFAKANPQKITFKSTFLKPVKSDDYDFTVTQSGKEFISELTLKNVAVAKKISIPMELIVYAEGDKIYSYDELKEAYTEEELGSKTLMYKDFSTSDWTQPITIELADMKVKDSVEPTVTTNSSTWKHIEVKGTVDGTFAWITAERPNTLSSVMHLSANDAWTKELGFGKDDVNGIGAWTADPVKLLLKRTTNLGPVNPPEPGNLNVKDHFAYVIGYPDGMVKPEGNVTRAEVATIFFRMLKDEARDRYWSKTNNYTDVKSTDWFNNAISTLSNMNIINGYPDGTFRPNAGITRAEFAKIAVSFFQDYSRQTLGDLFSDISGKWYTEYINLAAELAIVNGYPDGTFRPDNLITRAEAMTIVNNTLRRTPHKDGLLPEKDMITWPDNPKTAWYYEAVQEATNSHEYNRATIHDKEQWTKELPVRDWAAFERAWSDSHSAANPGDVVDGQNGYLQP